MIEHLGYPPELKSELPSNYLDFGCNNLVWDISNDLIVRLGSGKKIIKAMRAFEAISEEEIEKVYGAEKIFHTNDFTKEKWQEGRRKVLGFWLIFRA